MIKIDNSKCTKCKKCIDSCPTDAISIENDTIKIDHDACIECGICIDECEYNAISEE